MKEKVTGTCPLSPFKRRGTKKKEDETHPLSLFVRPVCSVTLRENELPALFINLFTSVNRQNLTH